MQRQADLDARPLKRQRQWKVGGEWCEVASRNAELAHCCTYFEGTFNAAGWAWDMESDLLMALAQGLFGCL